MKILLKNHAPVSKITVKRFKFARVNFRYENNNESSLLMYKRYRYKDNLQSVRSRSSLISEPKVIRKYEIGKKIETLILESYT